MAKDKTVSQYVKENLGIGFSGVPQKGVYQPLEQTKAYAQSVSKDARFLFIGLSDLEHFHIGNPKEQKDYLKKMKNLKKMMEQIRDEINFIRAQLG